MQTSSAGLLLIKESEGFRDHVYLDIAGFPTIGYGHKLRADEHYVTVTPQEAEDVILQRDVKDAERAVESLVKVALTQGQFDALVDFVFNLGLTHLATSTLLIDLNEGKYEDAATQLLRWDHSGGHEVQGLKKRRQAEFDLWHNKTV